MPAGNTPPLRGIFHLVFKPTNGDLKVKVEPVRVHTPPLHCEMWRPPSIPTFIISGIVLISGRVDVRSEENLSDYRSSSTAITASAGKSAPHQIGSVPFLGASLKDDLNGKLCVEEVLPGSPASNGGLTAGDEILEANGRRFKDKMEFREWLHSCASGDQLRLTVLSAGQRVSKVATLDSLSHPLKASNERVYVGLTYGEPDDRGAVVESVSKDSPAAKAGLVKGDILVSFDGLPVTTTTTLTDLLTEKRPGETLDLAVLRGEEPISLSVKLGLSANGLVPLSLVLPSIWRRDQYRLAVIGVEFSDTKMNPIIKRDAWDEAFFSNGTYRDKKSVTGQQVHGSLADFYRENSCGKLNVSGKVFSPVAVSKTRAEWSSATRDTEQSAFYNEVLDRLQEREGAEVLKEYDGLMFIYAGERYPKINRNTLFWPHRANFMRAGRRWSYFICPEGGQNMVSISVFCHEFGHMLGLPDLYARPENPGSEGLGVWCLMSNERGAGKPQHLSAWCKEQLGWIKPAVLDPKVPQKLLLGPVEGSPDEVYKVLLRPDGAEYLLLENRRRKGFDESLPAEGLLIWHVVGRKPILEESHGIEGPSGPRIFLGSVPYPSRSNHSFTPFTTPSSRPLLGGGYPVHLTNIRQLPDGRIAFLIGYEYQ